MSVEKTGLLEGQQNDCSSMENMSTISEDSSFSESKSDFLEPSFVGTGHSVMLNASRLDPSSHSTSALNTSGGSLSDHQRHASGSMSVSVHGGGHHATAAVNVVGLASRMHEHSKQSAYSLGDRSGYTSETSLGGVSCASSSSNLALPSGSGGPMDTSNNIVQQLLQQSQNHGDSNYNLHSMSGSCSNLSAVSCGSQRGGRDMLFSPGSPGADLTDLSLYNRLDEENKLLRTQVDTLKCRIKSLLEENKSLRLASVSIQARAEQEEEYISNTLLKRIEVLKKEKEALALNYEQEEECLTNDLSRKLNQLRAEMVQLEKTLEQEQEALVNKLMRKIKKLEGETTEKQLNLEQLRREKIELENTLEQEQEALANKFMRKIKKLEGETTEKQLN